MADELTFAALDDLLLARELGRVPRGPLLGGLSVSSLGPALELRAFDEEESTLARVKEALGPVISPRAPQDSPVAHLPLDGLEADSADWVRFGMTAQRAAERTGFPKRIAQGLIGAIGELLDNVHEHSEAPATGVVAYRAHGSEFEFVVSDRGVGVLSSLQTASEWQSVATSEEALQVALSDGNSRFGRGSNRGYGFRDLFRGLATVGSYLRFRTGDASLEIGGVRPQLASARVFQRPHLPGFHISVVCCQQLR